MADLLSLYYSRFATLVKSFHSLEQELTQTIASGLRIISEGQRLGGSLPPSQILELEQIFRTLSKDLDVYSYRTQVISSVTSTWNSPTLEQLELFVGISLGQAHT
jgi:hypothetical protein